MVAPTDGRGLCGGRGGLACRLGFRREWGNALRNPWSRLRARSLRGSESPPGFHSRLRSRFATLQNVPFGVWAVCGCHSRAMVSQSGRIWNPPLRGVRRTTDGRHCGGALDRGRLSLRRGEALRFYCLREKSHRGGSKVSPYRKGGHLHIDRNGGRRNASPTRDGGNFRRHRRPLRVEHMSGKDKKNSCFSLALGQEKCYNGAMIL